MEGADKWCCPADSGVISEKVCCSGGHGHFWGLVKISQTKLDFFLRNQQWLRVHVVLSLIRNDWKPKSIMARFNIFDEFKKLLNINTNCVIQDNKTTRQLIYLYNQRLSWQICASTNMINKMFVCSYASEYYSSFLHIQLTSVSPFFSSSLPVKSFKTSMSRWIK